jgi:uncharacterized protein (TIGR02996 family)
MSAEDGFLRAIIDNPDDDTPRLVFADWLDEHGDSAGRDRAEFIRIQLELAKLSPEQRRTSFDERVVALRRRQYALFDANGKRWMEALPACFRKRLGVEHFERGFLARAHGTARRFAEHGERLVSRAPVRVLAVRQAWNCIELVAGLSWLPRIDQLQLGSNRLRDAHIRILAASPNLAGLRTLSLYTNRIGNGGAEALARSPHLTRLLRLHLEHNRITDQGALALLDSPRLKGATLISLGYNQLSEGVKELLRERFKRMVS